MVSHKLPCVFAALSIVSVYAVGQHGSVTTNTYCDGTGASATYTDVLSATTRTITTNGCPNSYNACQKKDCTTASVEATVQTNTYTIPAYPVLATATTDTTCKNGAIAVALNGVAIFGQSDGTSACADAVTAEGDTFDRSGGHATAFGEYHYHIPPAALLHQLGNGAVVNGVIQHSPQIGWSLDGFPIYGGYGYNNVTMMPCGMIGSDPNVCLDACGGYQAALPTVDQYLYRYYIPGPVGSFVCSTTVLDSDTGICQWDGATGAAGGCCVNQVPGPDYYPYTIGCYRGCTSTSTGCTGTAGYTFTTAPVVAGVTSVYTGTSTSTNTTNNTSVTPTPSGNSTAAPTQAQTSGGSMHIHVDIQPVVAILSAILLTLNFL